MRIAGEFGDGFISFGGTPDDREHLKSGLQRQRAGMLS
jgi:hypothetical protein